jgi:glycosyltransferase involved in cell wall biosynthesis
MELIKAEGVPFSEYQQLMDGSDAILDQLYSYTPSMNPLMAMSKGIICIGGGEPENYEIINEHELRPIINVQPTYESVREELEQLVLHPDRIPELKRQSIEYVRKHHDYIKVAKEYEALYTRQKSR